MSLKNGLLLAIHTLLFVQIAFCGQQPESSNKESRIFMVVYINDQPVKLALDTGAEITMLFRQAANRLKLSVKEPSSDIKPQEGEVKFGITEKCRLKMTKNGEEDSLQLAVVDIPDYLYTDFDGVIGWGGFKHLIVELYPSFNRATISDKLNFKKSEWKSLDIRTDLDVLVIKTSSKDKTQDCFLFDTGFTNGIMLRKELWPKSTSEKTDQNTTLSSMFFPGVGLVVDKEKWVEEFNLAGLPLSDIPVTMGMELNPALIKTGVDGIIGMWAMSCYTWILDGASGKVYFKKNELKRIPQKYAYNRLAAVFVPEDIQTTNPLLAHVIKDGPAYKAGIRDGDELLKIGKLDATKWRTDPNVMPLSKFWCAPAGTKVDLVLMRNNKEIKISVTLEEIFNKN